MAKLGFAILGCGAVGKHHITAIAQVREARLAAVCDVREEVARHFGEQAGVPWFTCLSAMLAKQHDIDAVNVCTPSGAHLEPALEVIAAGKHCVVEKPLEITLDRCDRIIEAADRAGVQLCAVFPSRFGIAARAMKEAVAAGRFGKLTLGDAYVRWWREPSYYATGGWRGTWALDGGGAMINQSIHYVDLIQWYMGPAKAITALTGRLAHPRIEVEDTGLALVEWANGALGVIQGTTAAWPGFPRRIVISGDAGSAVLEEDAITLWQFKAKQAEDDEARERLARGEAMGSGAADPMAFSPENHRRQLEDFCSALTKGTKPLVEGREGRKAVEIILAIYKSAEEGRRVELPLSPEYKPGKRET